MTVGTAFSVDAHVASFIAKKGSIAVDGVSLTVTAVGEDDGTGENDTVWFEVGLIPTTLAEPPWGTSRSATAPTSKSTCWPSTPGGC